MSRSSAVNAGRPDTRATVSTPCIRATRRAAPPAPGRLEFGGQCRKASPRCLLGTRHPQRLPRSLNTWPDSEPSTGSRRPTRSSAPGPDRDVDLQSSGTVGVRGWTTVTSRRRRSPGSARRSTERAAGIVGQQLAGDRGRRLQPLLAGTAASYSRALSMATPAVAASDLASSSSSAVNCPGALGQVEVAEHLVPDRIGTPGSWSSGVVGGESGRARIVAMLSQPIGCGSSISAPSSPLPCGSRPICSTTPGSMPTWTNSAR